jgi:hypothetical protein
MNSATGPTSVPTIIRQADQDITSVREALGITTPAPVVLISGGADTFDPAKFYSVVSVRSEPACRLWSTAAC